MPLAREPDWTPAELLVEAETHAPRLLAEGLDNETIAVSFGLSVNTDVWSV